MIPEKIEQFLKVMNEPDFFDREHMDTYSTSRSLYVHIQIQQSLFSLSSTISRRLLRFSHQLQ